MAFCIRFEDILDGISNYLQWKFIIATILKENKIWNFVNTIVVVPPNNLFSLYLHEIKEANAQRILLDGVKDHLIPHLAEKPTTQVMWDTLKNLFEAKNENRKMALKDKLHEVRMTKEDNLATYLTRLAKVKDEIAIVGEVISD